MKASSRAVPVWGAEGRLVGWLRAELEFFTEVVEDLGCVGWGGERGGGKEEWGAEEEEEWGAEDVAESGFQSLGKADKGREGEIKTIAVWNL